MFHSYVKLPEGTNNTLSFPVDVPSKSRDFFWDDERVIIGSKTVAIQMRKMQLWIILYCKSL